MTLTNKTMPLLSLHLVSFYFIEHRWIFTSLMKVSAKKQLVRYFQLSVFWAHSRPALLKLPVLNGTIWLLQANELWRGLTWVPSRPSISMLIWDPLKLFLPLLEGHQQSSASGHSIILVPGMRTKATYSKTSSLPTRDENRPLLF